MKCFCNFFFKKRFYFECSNRSRRQIFRFTNVKIKQNQFNFCTFNNSMEDMRINVKLSERLSPLARPENYKLELRPNLETGVFQGNVKIDVLIKQERNYINLHSNFLNIIDIKVYKGEDEVTVAKFLEIKQMEQLFIHFDSALSSGLYKICIDFTGDLTRNIVGFYSSRLNDARYINYYTEQMYIYIPLIREYLYEEYINNQCNYFIYIYTT